MRPLTILPFLVLSVLTSTIAQQPVPLPAPVGGVRLQDLAWPEAEQRLKLETVVVLPLGAAAQQHGPHMKLGTDAILVDYLTRRAVETTDVVVAPALTYQHAAAFLEYPGTTSLSVTTARDLVVEAARSLARYGPRRFYVLNVSPLAHPALEDSAKMLTGEGVILRFTSPHNHLDGTARRIRRQVVGNHADELETSMMLFVDPGAVDMTRATREYDAPSTPFRLTRRRTEPGTHSPSGVWGDAQLATREKGRELIETLLAGIRADIDELRRAPLLTASPATSATRPEARMDPRVRPLSLRPGECLPGDVRTIREIGPRFYKAWMDHDAIRLASFWTSAGDMVHPDGFVEGNAKVIQQNRTVLFARPEYKDSRHELQIGEIRCIADDVAIADAKWELRGVVDARRQPVPPSDGLCTLVLKRSGPRWLIEAYRYSMNPQRGPSVLQRPGMPEKQP
jgi:creatinine amidohydrolase